MKAKLDQILKILTIPDDYTIIIEKERCTLPTACIYPESKLIKITGNIPSLVRYALAELILHEIAEDEFHHLNPDHKGDSHFHPEFQDLERAWRQELAGLIGEEHE